MLEAALHEQGSRELAQARALLLARGLDAAGIADTVIDMYNRGEFDVATLFYARFKTVIAQIPTAQQIVSRHAKLARKRAGFGMGDDATPSSVEAITDRAVSGRPAMSRLPDTRNETVRCGHGRDRS